MLKYPCQKCMLETEQIEETACCGKSYRYKCTLTNISAGFRVDNMGLDKNMITIEDWKHGCIIDACTKLCPHLKNV